MTPNPELHDDLAEIVDEAMLVMPHSPRAAAGLLRLLIDLLTKRLDEEPGGSKRDTLYHHIDASRETGRITEPTKNDLQVIRLRGNDAVHEGVILMDGDDSETVLDMLRLVNSIAAQAIDEPLIADRRAKGVRSGLSNSGGSVGDELSLDPSSVVYQTAPSSAVVRQRGGSGRW